MNSLVFPATLSRGDTIGIAAPAGMIFERTRFDRGIRILKEMGFEPVFPRDLWPGHGYLADNDMNRSQEFMRLVMSDDVKAVMAARGGYGSLRLLPHLNFDILGKYPKPIVGFSDLTILLGQLFSKSQLVTLHGPVVTSLPDLDKLALERFYYCLAGQYRKSITHRDIEVLRAGEDAQGVLMGGNLSSLLTLVGTPYEQNWEGSILFIEDVNEPLYKVDRMLTQLKAGKRLEGLAGLLVGDFSFDDKADPVDRLRYTEAVWNLVMEVTAGEGYPVWGGFPVGHFRTNYTLPLGCSAVMDSRSATLLFP